MTVISLSWFYITFKNLLLPLVFQFIHCLSNGNELSSTRTEFWDITFFLPIEIFLIFLLLLNRKWHSYPFYSLTCLHHKVIFSFALKKDINCFRHFLKLLKFNCVIFKISCGSCGGCYPQIIKLIFVLFCFVPIVKTYTTLDLFLEYLCQPIGTSSL